MIHFTRPTTCTCNISTGHQSNAICFGGQLPSSGSHTNVENSVTYDIICSVTILLP